MQGEQAPAELISALGRAESQVPDLILITRGGGSLEDLWAFNDEGLARAIADCHIPVVSAVGHQTDHSISDMVADMAAPTPSAAAELITPDKADLKLTFDRIIKQLQRLHVTGLQLKSQQLDILSSRLEGQHPARRMELTHNRLVIYRSRLQQIIGHRLIRTQDRLDQLKTNLKANSPQRHVVETRARLADLDTMLERTMQHRIEASRSRLQTQLRTLEAISPMTVLQRGYSVTRDSDDTTIQSIDGVRTGDEIRTTLTDGELRSTVTTVTSTDA